MKPRLEWKVGVFVFIGLVLLAVLLLQFSKGMTFFRPTYDIYLRAPNVGGLKVRAQVLMSGVQVGTVSGIRLAPDGKSVTITLKIYSEYVIHQDARFVIEQSGFLGDQYVAIVPTENKGDVFRHRGVAQAEAPFNMQEVARSAAGFLMRIDETAKKLNDSIVDVRRYLLNEHTLTNVSVAAANLRLVSEGALTTVDGFNALLKTNGPSLAQSASNLVLFSAQMDRFATNLDGLVATNSPDIHQAVKNIESSTEVLKTVMDDLQAGRGLAGDLLRNQELATNVSQIAKNLSITSSNLNRLGLWGILWQHKPPRTNEPAPATSLVSPKNPFE